ncbi:MAG: hydrogenase formation protein HypD [Phycisphaerales bacterium]|nr:hydrogenase formation protein HypD [Phycisphaerales bacterium]
MKYVDEYRDSETILKLADEIKRLAKSDREYNIMEICGGHTHTIFRYGLAQLLPKNINLIHGPGCPVCVLPMGRMDVGLAMAEREDLIFTAFGDMMRVPGSTGSPLESKARGADVRMVYSPLDALKIAEKNPDRPVMFFAIGFETTAPSTAVTLLRAKEAGVKNFFVYCNHILVNPAIRALLDMDDMRIDAFIGPGHVSSVIGCEPYRFIAEDYNRPVAVSGFEPVDILHSIVMLVKQLNANESKVENQYTRVVQWHGNPAAIAALDLVFDIREEFEWRGLGNIPNSAYSISEEFAEFDAERQIGVHGQTFPDPIEAQCGEVLKGTLKPTDCRLYGKGCTPEMPVGALMVSSEGACAAQYKYADLTLYESDES